MGVAIDTVAFSVNNPGATPTTDNTTVNGGDSKQIRNFFPPAKAYLDFLTRQGATEGFIGLTSPRLADSTRGIRYTVSETPAVLLLPRQIGQPLYPGDTLGVTVAGGTAEHDGGAFGVYYTDLPGSAAVIRDWSALAPHVVNIRPVEVDFNTSGTSGAWADTVITTTENLLKADKWYAVLGYDVDTAVTCFGFKGAETGNYRICGPGPTTTYPTSEYFLQMNEKHQRPYVPCFNGNNRAALFVSCCAVATTTAIISTLILAELESGFVP